MKYSNNTTSLLSVLIVLICMITVSTCEASKFDIRALGFQTYLKPRNFSMSNEEKLLQLVHVIDVLQTASFMNYDCYSEGNAVTSDMIGHNPNSAHIAGWAVGSAIAYHYSYQFIDNSNLPRWVKRGITLTNLALKIDTVRDNYSIGIRIGGGHDYSKTKGKC